MYLGCEANATTANARIVSEAKIALPGIRWRIPIFPIVRPVNLRLCLILWFYQVPGHEQPICPGNLVERWDS